MYGIEQLTTFAQLGHETYISGVFVYLLDPNYIRMIDVFKYIDLILKSFLILNMTSGNLLDCNFLIRMFIYCLINSSICTFTKLFYKLIVFSYRRGFRLDPKISLKTSFSHFQYKIGLQKWKLTQILVRLTIFMNLLFIITELSTSWTAYR